MAYLSDDAKIVLLRAKRPREAGPVPEKILGENPDRWRGKVFGRWMRQNQITTDGLAAATQIPRTVISCLTGGGGDEPRFGWSKISAENVENILKTVSLIKPLEIEGLYQLLDMDSEEVKWGDFSIPSMRSENDAIHIDAGAVAITWHQKDERPPHVYRDKSGSLRVSGAQVDGLKRLGRLASIERLEVQQMPEKSQTAINDDPKPALLSLKKVKKHKLEPKNPDTAKSN